MSKPSLARRSVVDRRVVSAPIEAPAESHFRIEGRPYRLQSWTQAQWERLLVWERPRDAWLHGLIIVRITPS